MRLLTMLSLTRQGTADLQIPDNGDNAWYAQPVWTAVGVIALVLIILLIRLVERRNRTTKP